MIRTQRASYLIIGTVIVRFVTEWVWPIDAVNWTLVKLSRVMVNVIVHTWRQVNEDVAQP